MTEKLRFKTSCLEYVKACSFGIQFRVYVFKNDIFNMTATLATKHWVNRPLYFVIGGQNMYVLSSQIKIYIFSF